MDIRLKEPVKNMNDVLPIIHHLFPGKQLMVPPLNKKRLMIYESGSKASVVLILKDKGSRIVVKGEPNMKNPGLMVILIFGVLCSPLGILIAMGIIYGTGGAERQRLANEAYELVKPELE